eukprot:TCONS_00009654-protein
MDSAHADERNLAHSASGRNTTNDQQIRKLKEEHLKEIEKLKMEFKIQQLESENEKKLKTMQLEKDNQTLSHQFELFKLKNSHGIDSKQIVADAELQDKINEMEKQLSMKIKEIADMKNEMTTKLNEKDKEIATKENDCKMKFMTKDQEMLTKENDFKLQIKELGHNNIVKLKDMELKMKDLENDHNLKLVELTKAKDATIEALRNKIENLEAKNNQRQEEDEAQAGLPVKRVFTDQEKLTWGVDTFFEDKKLLDTIYKSYQDWYQGISLILTHGKQQIINIDTKQYMFMKKDFVQRCEREWLFIGLKQHIDIDYYEEGYDFIVERVDKKVAKSGKMFLLHPEFATNSMKFRECLDDNNWWRVSKVTKDYYHDGKFAIILIIYLNKICM